MKKHCGNCANHSNKTNQFSKECGMCVAAVLENGERTDPSHWREKPKTNADRIRAMSDEELAELFHGFCDNGERCVYCPLYEKSCAGVHSDVPKWLEWLQQPAEGE
ncbi:MAG: hypothetical protein E7438_03250 [Ruminococcaceae bacterium]|nr:hypothetical protein [Oscillospiraceae bacterium]